ncbi:hypothetical protein BASA83_001024 [Batrachochytrium salamandrivorans]|nr:hypothetical protein BASA83_001024 [Batrachochytrium salamandrivorans]
MTQPPPPPPPRSPQPDPAPSEEAALPGDDEHYESLSQDVLISKLREAHQALQDRERDLFNAAEIGAQLVQVNDVLMLECSELKKALYSDPMYAPPSSDHAEKVAETSDQTAQRSKTTSTASVSSMLQVDVRYPTPQSMMSSPEEGRPAQFEKTMALSPDTLQNKGALSEKGPMSPHHHKYSGVLYEYISLLEGKNADLQLQLDSALANIHDSDVSLSRSHMVLRESNKALQTDLHKALTELRDQERLHTRTVASLEKDMGLLREDLARIVVSSADLEAEKRSLLKEKLRFSKESKQLEIVDLELIAELKSRISTIEADYDRLKFENQELDSRYSILRSEHAAAHGRISELIIEARNTQTFTLEQSQHDQVIKELREQLEEMQNRVVLLQDELVHAGGDMSPVALDKQLVRSKERWEWMPWLERTRIKAWEHDIAGLHDEIAHLRDNQDQAYDRLKNEFTGLVGRIVQYSPIPLKPLSDLASSVLGVPPPLSNISSITELYSLSNVEAAHGSKSISPEIQI